LTPNLLRISLLPTSASSARAGPGPPPSRPICADRWSLPPDPAWGLRIEWLPGGAPSVYVAEPETGETYRDA
jgi:hypothetical protein